VLFDEFLVMALDLLGVPALDEFGHLEEDFDSFPFSEVCHDLLVGPEVGYIDIFFVLTPVGVFIFGLVYSLK